MRAHTQCIHARAHACTHTHRLSYFRFSSEKVDTVVLILWLETVSGRVTAWLCLCASGWAESWQHWKQLSFHGVALPPWAPIEHMWNPNVVLFLPGDHSPISWASVLNIRWQNGLLKVLQEKKWSYNLGWFLCCSPNEVAFTLWAGLSLLTQGLIWWAT